MEKLILDFIIQHENIFETIGYYIVFILSLLESMPVIGFIVPGQSVIIASGFLAKHGLISFGVLFFVSSIGAILGDIFAYILGRKYGENFLKNHGGKFFVKDSMIQKTKDLLNDHPGKVLLFGRLNSITRSLAPFMAGVSNIRTSLFLFFCVGGCILWSVIFSSLGFIFARGFEIMAPMVGKFIFTSTLIVIMFMVILNFMKNKGFRLSKNHIHMLVLNFVSLYVFATLSESVARGSKIAFSFDERIALFLKNIHTPFLDKLFIFLSYIDTPKFIIAVAIVSIFIIFKKKTKELIPGILILISGYLMVFFTKIIFQRPRPFVGMLEETGFSFPSGHATLSTIFFLIIIYHFSLNIKSELKRIIFVSLNILFVFLFSFSRIYLGVHHTTDIIAGVSIGVWMFTLTILASKMAPWFYKKIKREQIIPNL